LVQETGDAMDSIVSAFQQVVSLVAQIADASHEQQAGIGQVSQAIAQMDQVTQHNAALVEEAAAAAESLEGQADVLNRTVSVFKLAEAGSEAEGADLRVAHDIDFDDLVYSHRQWPKRLRRIVEGRGESLDPEQVSRDDACPLGKWLYGAGRELQTNAAYEALRATHRQFHQCAGDILRHLRSGEREQAERLLLGELGALSIQTVAQIRRLEQECQQGSTLKRLIPPSWTSVAA
jgi:methyl-accepting chemotaxis protein